MQPPCPDAAPTLDGTPFGLCSACPGVAFVTTTGSGRRIPCITTAAVLQQDYGAAHDLPSEWLSAFVRHRQDIDGWIIAALAGREDVDRVILDHVAGATTVFMRLAA